MVILYGGNIRLPTIYLILLVIVALVTVSPVFLVQLIGLLPLNDGWTK